MFTDYNKNSNSFSVTTKGFPYVKLEDLYKEDPKTTHKIDAFYINNKSKFGVNVVAVSNGKCVNLPSHLTKTVEQMIANPDTVNYIKEGHAGFEVRTYESHGKTCYTCNWIDM